MPKIFKEPAATVALFDQRPFFEKALSFGVQSEIIDLPKLDAIAEDAPKGIVQIARYFANENLLPELELARQRMVNLVSLHLEEASAGDLWAAAELLRDCSFLSLSKAGADMLKSLIAMPIDTHFGMNADVDERQLKKTLAEWSLKSHSEYRTELSVREPALRVIDAASWFAQQVNMSVEQLRNCERHAEAVIRTSLITLGEKANVLPDRVSLEKIILSWRRKTQAVVAKRIVHPDGMPEDYREVVETIRQSVLTDLAQLMDKGKPVKALFRSLRFKERYFWVEDLQSEMLHHESEKSASWRKITYGSEDDERALLTMFLSIAAGRRTAQPLLTEKTAATLIRKIRKTSFQPDAVVAYIRQHAPHKFHDSYLMLWNDFAEEMKSTVLNDHDYKLSDAMALLRRECNVKR